MMCTFVAIFKIFVRQIQTLLSYTFIIWIFICTFFRQLPEGERKVQKSWMHIRFEFRHCQREKKRIITKKKIYSSSEEEYSEPDNRSLLTSPPLKGLFQYYFFRSEHSMKKVFMYIPFLLLVRNLYINMCMCVSFTTFIQVFFMLSK